MQGRNVARVMGVRRRVADAAGGCRSGECLAALPPVECRGAGPAGEQLEGRGGWPGNWPVKIHLVPPNATYLEGARLVVAADCVPFVYPEFGEDAGPGRVVLTACPKLGDAWFVRAKLAQILSPNKIEEVEVLHVDVPCCEGLVRIVREAMKDARCEAGVHFRKIGLNGRRGEAFDFGEKAEALRVNKMPASARADAAAAAK